MSSIISQFGPEKDRYIELLKIVANLSGLFSESSIPYINYRMAENVFCKCFKAYNLSRSDTAFDAKIEFKGIGLKTFICEKSKSVEKVAEFNSLSHTLRGLDSLNLATQLATFRNDRIDLAKRLYDISDSIYHIVARRENELLLFDTPYDTISVNEIRILESTKSSLKFHDHKNKYTCNYSKSTLYREFIIPDLVERIKIDIVNDPYELLYDLFHKKNLPVSANKLVKGRNYIVLPLYSIKNGERYIHQKSGLNQWNADGRKRDVGEVYIQIPKIVRNEYPDFFPPSNVQFCLVTPIGEELKAKVCQQDGKALMTNPNRMLSEWLLRGVLQLQERQLATIELLDRLGFDSVIITKESSEKYQIDVMKTGSFEEFIDIKGSSSIH